MLYPGEAFPETIGAVALRKLYVVVDSLRSECKLKILGGLPRPGYVEDVKG